MRLFVQISHKVNLRNAIAVILLGLAIAVLPLVSPSAGLAAQNFHGNRDSKIYHNAKCKYYDCKKCVIVFKSADEAKKSGYRACKVCGG